MKTLTVNGNAYIAERIVKTDTDIVGYTGDTLIFSFKGITDFAQFQLAESEVFDTPDMTLDIYLVDLDFRISKLELGI